MNRTLVLFGALSAAIGTIILILALAPVSTSASVARATTHGAVTPKSGQTLPAGTEIQGSCVDNTTPAPDCDPETGCPVGTRIVHDVTGTDLYKEEPAGSGNWTYDSTFDPSTGCNETIDTPGSYRLAIAHQYSVETWDGTGWVTSDEQSSIRYVEFTIGAAGKPCDDEGAIKDVWSESGSDHGLKGKVLRNGQTISATEKIEITLGDDSVIRMDKGSRMIISCKDLSASARTWRESIGLLLGKIWAKVSHRSDPDYQIHTDRAVTGLRGTYLWLSYAPAKQLTTEHTISGTVTLTNRFGKHKVTAVAHAGHTATQQGNAPPHLASH
jgi:hypothetical protein